MQDDTHSYHCSQFFGYSSRSQQNIDEDNISALKFDPSGAMLALGDRAGRLIVFRASERTDHQEYDYSFEFQSHQSQFDTLRSVRLAEQIGHINWLRPQSKYLKLLTSNSNTIKLWKIFEKQHKYLGRSAGASLQMPHLVSQEPFVSVNLRKVYPNQACRRLNGITLSSNEEFMLATDDSNAFMWSIQQASHPFILKSLTRNDSSQAEKKERITCSHLHPTSDSLFIFGTNHGEVVFNDSRSSISQANTLTFSSPPTDNHFLSEIINKYCSVMFLEGSRKVVARDLISVKVWDMCNNKQPILSMPIDEDINSHLCDLFEADTLDDKFSLSSAGSRIATGNYSNSFHLIDSFSGNNIQYEMNYTNDTVSRQVGGSVTHKNAFSCTDKVLCHDFNPVTGQLAASTQNCFYIYSKTATHQTPTSSAG